jgi:hypothetical protein
MRERGVSWDAFAPIILRAAFRLSWRLSIIRPVNAPISLRISSRLPEIRLPFHPPRGLGFHWWPESGEKASLPQPVRRISATFGGFIRMIFAIVVRQLLGLTGEIHDAYDHAEGLREKRHCAKPSHSHVCRQRPLAWEPGTFDNSRAADTGVACLEPGTGIMTGHEHHDDGHQHEHG